jgi:hypothetical protein
MGFAQRFKLFRRKKLKKEVGGEETKKSKEKAQVFVRIGW